MAFFRQVIAPFLIVLVFLVALVAVSIRSFLPADMAAPAPIEETLQSENSVKAEPFRTVDLSDPSISSPVAVEASAEDRD